MADLLDLTGRVAIVTGAARGLGRAEALELAARGARIVACDLSEPQDTADAICERGGDAVALAVDVREESRSLLEAALTRYGRVDVLVNNAGVVRDAMCFTMSDEDWDVVLDVNLRAAFRLARDCARHWREEHKSGRTTARVIVNTSSESGLYGNVGQANYAAAKAGLAALTLTMAAELDRYRVRVNAIAPRARTSMSLAAFGEIPIHGHFDPLAPEHVAAFVAWLASDAARDVTGNVFVVHGSGVDLMGGWHVERRVDRASPWTDGELLALRKTLLGESPRRLAGSIAELFQAQSRGGAG
jgi:NAD(P)-dependent dehydrogenase (short-subunit alcohol dehydrogenase family)